MTGHYKVISRQKAENKRILMRVDFNVPMQNGKILDDTRLKRVIPGLSTLIESAKQIILITHLGRPKGNKNETLSTKPLQEYLAKAMSTPVYFLPYTDNISMLSEMINETKKLILLENCRFYSGEEQNDKELARSYASIADIYVNDAFSCSHRQHSSVKAITEFLPSYAGPLLAAEVEALSNVLETPKRPVAAFVGGAKISTKISLLENLIYKVDKLLLAGAMANTFLAAKKIPVAKSLHEPDLIPTAIRIMELAEQERCQIILPIDCVTSTSLEKGSVYYTRINGELENDEMILDIGTASVEVFKKHISECKTLLWNGPAGAFEITPYDKASKSLGQFIGIRTTSGQLTSVAGGGDTVAAVNIAGVAEQLSYLSLAGGAFLEWIEGKSLPGVEALKLSD